MTSGAVEPLNSGEKEIKDGGPCDRGSLGRVLVALSQAPETVLYRVSVSVNDIGGVQVNLHSHVWSQVERLTELLGVGWVPDQCEPLPGHEPAVMVALFNQGAATTGGITVAWFTDTESAGRLEPIWEDAITFDRCWLPPVLADDSASRTD